MAMDFDPAWEYWMPDPEVAELLAESGLRCGINRIDQAFMCDELPSGRSLYVGVRFGRGNPNFFRGRLRPLRPRVPRPESPDRLIYRPRCRQCGERFWSSRIDKPYCSAYCRQQPRRATCKWCGREFRRTTARRFCTQDCARAHFVARWHETHPNNGSMRQLPDRNCARCGVFFRPSCRDHRHCSQACGWAGAWRTSRRQWGDRPCSFCGEVFRPLARNGEYCSRRCRDLGQLQPWPAAGCPGCGGELGVGLKGPRAYCSRACTHTVTLRRGRLRKMRITAIEAIRLAQRGIPLKELQALLPAESDARASATAS